ncbi:MAG: methylenetetrahydrofolate reductase [NAD(P)H] [Gammaproteobacteria bacterium]|nr:methylenetetrahydrofolate reductase [NAD(P)H] [Gammaproteobacteria bacterium]MBL7000437.1 methylenetetrahydrofolate reductase [NAD(P)H] [Gammaproteobacteria bacterium]
MTTHQLELSYEFFPPRTDIGREKLAQTRVELAELDPRFYSVTFGAGGSTRDNTLETVIDIQQNTTVDACPHLTCVGATNAEIIDMLEKYRQNGIHRLVVLRGDLPSGMVGMGECKHASDLVRLIRKQFGDHFTLAVAAYPEAHPNSKNMLSEIQYFAEKMNAGADFAITQYFYNSDSYYNFMELCARNQISKPVIPGIMPIANFDNLKKFSKQCGAEIPRWIKKSMAAYENDLDSQRQFGIEIVSRMAQELIQYGAPGFHFYTMNQSSLTRSIVQNLNILE